MAQQPTFLKPPAAVPPLAAPQVILTLVGNQVQLKSNITPGPQTWRVIAQLCAQGVQAALNEVARQEQETQGPRIVVPTLQMR